MEACTRHALPGRSQHSTLCQRHAHWRCHRTYVSLCVAVSRAFCCLGVLRISTPWGTISPYPHSPPLSFTPYSVHSVHLFVVNRIARHRSVCKFFFQFSLVSIFLALRSWQQLSLFFTKFEAFAVSLTSLYYPELFQLGHVPQKQTFRTSRAGFYRHRCCFTFYVLNSSCFEYLIFLAVDLYENENVFIFLCCYVACSLAEN